MTLKSVRVNTNSLVNKRNTLLVESASTEKIKLAFCRTNNITTNQWTGHHMKGIHDLQPVEASEKADR